MAKSPTNTQLTKRLAKVEREMQIQEALDRVRSKALAMQTTEDIGPVVGETRDAFEALGINIHRTTITLVVEAAYFGEAEGGAGTIEEAPWPMVAATWTLAGGCVVFGLTTDLTVGIANRVATLLLTGTP